MIMKTSNRRLLIIGLDGLEISYAEKLMAAGQMPALAALQERSAKFLLDHGAAQRTGLAWEHVASGLSPQDSDRWSAVEFDPATYEARQAGARFVPFLASLNARVTVFDPPYFDLDQCAQVQGVVGWGAHDPGIELAASPPALLPELQQRFGLYPSSEWTYACPCHSSERCQNMGAALAEAVRTRQQIARWLLTEQCPDSEIFFVVTGEIHSAIEGLWHGVDPLHPLHTHPSAPAAAAALLEVHQAVDRMIGDLIDADPEAEVIAFAMGGMGCNYSDLQSMALLPELLYRHTFKRSRLRIPKRWSALAEGVPQLQADEHWDSSKSQWFANQFANWFSIFRPQSPKGNLWWHNAMQYQPGWHQMPAFALPSFYDGKIRINLQGREQQGRVALEDYETVCAQLEALIRQCRDPRLDAPAVAQIERPDISHPFELSSSDADMTIVWNSPANALTHPDYGTIGPLPFRRTGGHTGAYGVALIASPHIQPGFQGVRSSFDMMPTIVNWFQETPCVPLSGRSLCKLEGQSEER